MKKLILVIAILGVTAFADYIPTKTDRNFKRLCLAYQNNNEREFYKLSKYAYVIGVMAGMVSMARLSHKMNHNNTIDSNYHGLISHVCEKTLFDYKSIDSYGFKNTLENKIYLHSRKYD